SCRFPPDGGRHLREAILAASLISSTAADHFYASRRPGFVRFQLSVRNLSDLRREPGILGTPLRPSSGFEESHVTLPRRMRGRGFRSGSVVRRLPPLVRAAYGLFRRRAW